MNTAWQSVPWIAMAVLSLGMAKAADRPNVVVVLADDLGYGDVRCYDPEFAKVPTPCIDRLAEQGLRFTNAHANASLCSPTRYSLLTGRSSWRTPLREHVVRQYGSPLIPADRLTLPALLQEQGYRTACFGKWHLGWDWPLRQEDGTVSRAPAGAFTWSRKGTPVFEEAINAGPITRGFDRYFGVDVPNYAPRTFIENDRMTAPPTEKGTTAAGWKEDQILPAIVEQTVDYIDGRAEDKAPFFIYMALTSPHEPVAPSAPFRGKSGISPVADFIMETDAALGAVMTALEHGGLAEDTILIFSSDNGHCGYTGLMPFVRAGHRVGGPYRGYKGNISEGGHRVPMVVRWPRTVKPGTTTDQLVALGDIMATAADIVAARLPDDAAEDSVSFFPLLRGQDAPVREDLIVQCYRADLLAILDGTWKLSLCAGDGCTQPVCNEKGVPHDTGERDARSSGAPAIQLYNVKADPGETTNLQADHPDIVRRLHASLVRCVTAGRSTPGPARKNDVKINLPPLAMVPDRPSTSEVISSPRATAKVRPNIVWISAEDLSAGTLGCYGGQAHTPRLDALAAMGLRFEAAFAAAPVCAPSRSAIITGVKPTSLGSLPMRCQATVPRHVEGLPRQLAAAGYFCTNNGKTDYNFTREFDAGWHASGGTAHWRHRPDRDQPFFAVFNLMATHESGLFDAAPAAIRRRLPETARGEPDAVRVPPFYPDTPPVRNALAARLDLAATLDRDVGEILDALAADDLADDTIVIFWSDHGEGIPHGKRSLTEHGLRVPLIVRVPERFVAAAQLPDGRPPRGVTGNLISLVDLAPTMLSFAGIPAPAWMEGRIFLGPRAVTRPFVVAARDRMDEAAGFGRSVRDDRFFYVRNFLPWIPGDDLPTYAAGVPITGELRAARKAGTLPAAAGWFARDHRPAEELFDVDADRDELIDLARHPAHDADRARLREILSTWMRETRDTGVVPEPILRREARAVGSEWAIFHPANDPDAAARRYAAILDAAWAVADELRLARYADLVGSPEAAVRYWAVCGAAWSALRPGADDSHAAAVLTIEPTLADDDPAVRINAARWICRLEPPDDDSRALGVLAAGLRSGDADIRFAALASIDDIGGHGRTLWEEAAGLAVTEGETCSRQAIGRIRARLADEQIPADR